MNNIKKLGGKVAAIVGIAFGAFALSAFAAWTSAPGNPPNNNTPAPINVGASTQYKVGALGIGASSGVPSGTLLDVFGVGVINDLFTNNATTNNLAVLGGSPAAGKVLTSDASGNATWQDPVSGGGSGSGDIDINSRVFFPVPDSTSDSVRRSLSGERIFVGVHTFCALAGLRNNFNTTEDTHTNVMKSPGTNLYGYGMENLSYRRLSQAGEWYITSDHVTSDLEVSCMDITVGGVLQ